MIPWRRIKWAVVGYLIGERQALYNTTLHLSEPVELADGYVKGCRFIGDAVRVMGPLS